MAQTCRLGYVLQHCSLDHDAMLSALAEEPLKVRSGVDTDRPKLTAIRYAFGELILFERPVVIKQSAEPWVSGKQAI